VSVVPDRLETIRDVVEPALGPLGLQIYDLVVVGGAVRLVLDRPGGVDIDTLEAASRAVAPRIEELGELSGPYTLEVSSPGVERTLRTPEHFAGAVGTEVSVKARGDDGAMERVRGVLTASDADTITLRLADGERRIAIDTIEQARTVFDWSPAPKPGKGSKPGRTKKEAVARP
jgi:ribosome maturation factor RimP